MSDDERVGRGSREPDRSGPSGGARWADYLGWLREDIIETVRSLPAAEQRTSRLPSGWTPIELLSHVLHMEQRWFVWGFLGEPVDEPWGDWNVPEPWVADAGAQVRPGARWVVPEDVTVEDVVARLRGVGDRTRSVLSSRPLNATAASGGRFRDDPPTLEWICFHVLAEYSRHAGQLDIVAETARR